MAIRPEVMNENQPIPLDQELEQFLEGQVGEKEVAGTLMDKLLLEDDISNTQDPKAAASAFAKMFRENPDFAKQVMAMIKGGQNIPTEGGGSQWPEYQGQWGGFTDQHQGGDFLQTPQPQGMDPRFGPEESELLLKKYGEGGGDLRKGRSQGKFDFGGFHIPSFQQGGPISNRSSRRTPMDDKVARVLLNQLTMRNVKK